MASREAGSHLQDDVLRHSLDKPEEFWARQAEHLHWHKKPTETLRHTRRALKDGGVTHDSWEWFPGGEISTCYNCIDRHVEAGRGDNTAIYYDSPVTKTKEAYSYRRLLDEVEVLAGVLRSEGVKRGDVVMLYSKLAPRHGNANWAGQVLTLESLSADDSVCFNRHVCSEPSRCRPCRRF